MSYFFPECKYEYLYDSSDDESEEESQFTYNALRNHKMVNQYVCPSSQEEEAEQNFEFYEHITLPSDTLQGICLRYGITPIKLRQANNFSGNNLHLAPRKLKIPKLVTGTSNELKRLQHSKHQHEHEHEHEHRHEHQPICLQKKTKEFQIHFIMVHYEFLNRKEAECYLDIFDWNTDATLKGIEQDIKWERNLRTSTSSADLLSRRRQFFKNHYLEKNMKVMGEEDETKTMEDEHQDSGVGNGDGDSGSEARQRKPVVNVAIGVPLGVNRYVIKKECGISTCIEMKDLPRVVLNSIEHGGRIRR